MFFLKITFKKATDFWCPTLTLTLDFRTAKQQRHPPILPKRLIWVPKTKQTKSPVTAVKAAGGCPSCSPSPGWGKLAATSREQPPRSDHNSHAVTETVKLYRAQSGSSADVNQGESAGPIHTPAQDEMSLNRFALQMQEAKRRP